MQSWKLGSPTMCSWQSGEPGQPVWAKSEGRRRPTSRSKDSLAKREFSQSRFVLFRFSTDREGLSALHGHLIQMWVSCPEAPSQTHSESYKTSSLAPRPLAQSSWPIKWATRDGLEWIKERRQGRDQRRWRGRFWLPLWWDEGHWVFWAEQGHNPATPEPLRSMVFQRTRNRVSFFLPSLVFNFISVLIYRSLSYAFLELIWPFLTFWVGEVNSCPLYEYQHLKPYIFLWALPKHPTDSEIWYFYFYYYLHTLRF